MAEVDLLSGVEANRDACLFAEGWAPCSPETAEFGVVIGQAFLAVRPEYRTLSQHNQDALLIALVKTMSDHPGIDLGGVMAILEEFQGTVRSEAKALQEKG